MCWTVSFIFCILVSFAIQTHEYLPGVPLSEQDVVKTNSGIKVPFGRAVYVDPVKDLEIRVRDGDRCTVKVIQNDPLSQRPGKLTPSHFPCKFDIREVQYSHFGARTPPQDMVKLLLRYDTADDTIIVPFTINVQVLFDQLEVVTRNMPITVDNLLGVSTPIDNKALQFTYDKNKQDCEVMVLESEELPRYGEVVNISNSGVRQNCDSFLQADIRYRHTSYSSPNQDYIPMVVRVTDSNGNLLKHEYFQVTVRIKDGQPNTPPQPSFSSLLLMDVNQFIMTAITPQILSAQDSETIPEKLIFNITSPLSYGEGQIVSTDDQNVPISSFYQKDLDDLKIAYKPPASDSDIKRTFGVEMEVIDAEGLNSDPFSLMIIVHPKNTLAPLATRNSGLMLFEGQSRKLQSSKNLEIADENNIDDVIVSVKDGLRHGQLLLMGSPVKQFSPADLDAGLVTYQHDGSDTYSDNIIFKLDDGLKQVEFLFPITVYPEDDEPPVLNVNTGVTIRKEEMKITPFVLSATDVDSDEFRIKFELKNPRSSEGEIFMKQTEAPIDPQNWQFVNGSYKRAITTWTQQDLLEGRIFYRRTGDHKTEPIIDRIKFRVSDDNIPPNESGDKEFVIKIMPLDNIPPEPYLGTPLEIVVDEFEKTVITKKHLRFTDMDTKDRYLKYVITRKPYNTDPNNPLDPGKIVLSETPDQEVTNFTQAQVNHHKIAYNPPSVELGIIPRIIQFEFQVEDSIGNVLPGQTFTIRLKPVDNKPPVIYNKGLEVFENGFVTLSFNVLDADDVDTEPNSIVFTVKQVPNHGILNYGVKNLRKGATFTKKDIANGLVSYINNGAEKDSDKIELEISDGIHKVPITINIQIRPIDDEAPALEIAPGTIGASVNVKEGGKAPITTKIIKASDPDTEDLKITFLIDYPPRQGRIELNGVNTDRFTQGDMESERVFYIHNGAEIGETSTVDTFNLSISDMSNDLLLGGNKIDYIHVKVNIEPVDSVAPVVTVKPTLVVPEANKATITLFHLNSTDRDTKDDNIVCTILVQPLHGYVENISPGPGSERSRAGIPVTAFKIADIKSGFINYVQSVHKGVEPTNDRFTFSCSDGINFSPRSIFPVQIEPTNDEIPQIFMREFVVEEGMKLSIDLPILNADDLDVPKNTLTFRIKNKPKHGKIVVQLATGDEIIDSFTLDQISYGSNIMYEHDDSETKEDEFELEVSDGLHNTSKKVKVMIYPVDDETPRLAINDGLEVGKGEGKLVTNRLLKAEDIDTDDSTIMFVVRQPPRHGDFILLDPISRLPYLNLTKGTNFTQGDIDEELIMYVHTGREGVRDLIKFDVTDGRNTYVDRYFWISVEGVDLVYPDVINKGVELPEGGRVTLTTDVLSTSDLNSDDEYLSFIITRDPTRGHLESTDNPGIPVTLFTQMDLAGNKIYYVHTDGEETKMDSFEFEVTDGYNSVFRTFRISISDVDNKKPIVFINKLRILESGEGLITPFELKVEDRDTDDKKLKLTITQVPVHGKILYNNLYPITVFTMEDLRENRISYHHDGSESKEDNFSFTLTDGTHVGFYVYPDTAKETRRPQTVEIEIVPVDNNVPQVVLNRGASAIGPLHNGQLGYRFTNKVLRAEDSDSQEIVLQYIITVPPKHGVIINKALGNESISNFTQGDINGMVIYYILDDLENATSDIFYFKVVDAGANELPGQDFRLNWAWISLEYDTYEVNETKKYLKVKLFRRGYLGETSFIGIKTKNITAKQGEDFGKHYAEQVQFSPGQTEAYWKLRITDDSLFENGEEFEILLEEPVMAATEYPDKAVVTILDDEDVSTVEFPEPEYEVKENVGEILVPVERKGDLSKEMMVVCSTEAGSATGTIPASVQSFSDFISRPESHKSVIRFNQGEELKYCRLVIIDDSLYEDDESFKIRLSQPLGGKVGVQNVTKVIIAPDKHDVPFFYFGEPEYYVDESDGYVEVKVWRTGTDLSKPASVTVRSKPSDPPSAEAGNDYVGTGKTLNFPPGATLETFRITILDDLGQPVLEGPETFELVLRMPMNAELGKPSHAVVTINDSLSDLPSMQFRDTEYTALENDGEVTAYIIRSGDLGQVSTVHCYTRQDTAKVTEDYVERPNTNESLVIFEPGDREKPCTVILVNDSIHEQEEIFRLRLGSPSSETAGGALVGPKNVTKITIKDKGDKPVIKFEKNRYNVKEPRHPDDIAVVEVPIIRRGDLSKTSHVRVHTKDGSAKSGKDYVPFSRELEFGQNVSRIIVEIEILYDEEKEHREALTLHLRPDRDMIADIEDSKVIIYIQEVNIVADVTFPFEPMVVSLKDYDDAASASSSPIPGYPVVCITSCNPKHPDSDRTGTLCSSEGINDNLTEFRWRVAAPSGHDGVTSELRNIESRTFFTGTHDITLDSIYFAPGSRVQCAARAVNQDGDPGLELESKIVIISYSNGLCSPRIEGSTGAEPFTAKMRYTGPDDQDYPNLIKLTVVIPHRDGMLPAISTQPLSNFELTLSPDSLRVGTHKCSNLIDYQEVRTKHGFLTNDTKNPNVIGEVEPYQYSSDLRTDPTLRFYRNLDLEACMWDFTAYYDMSELVTDCGGTITSDGQVLNLVQSFVSVRVPLYVSYIFHSPVATGGWQHNDLTSHLRLTFVYDTAILWKNGIGAPEESQLQGNLYPTGMRIREDGRLVVNFRTEPRFKGRFVLSHPGSGLTSMVMSQDQPELTFTLELIRSEPTYAQPEQQWEFVSDLAVRDYSGNYHVKLIPCTATDTMEYSHSLECNPRDPIVFDLQIRFQQVSDPVPAEFSLNTHFHLIRKKALWLSDGSMGFGEDSDVSFVPGDTVYGRIMVDPVQNLGESFYMTIEKCFLCTGEDGYVPKYNPDNYEYGCMAESPNLLHTFKIIDRGAPNTVKNYFRNVSFNAVLAVDDVEPEVANLKNQPGADGFRFDSAPLFQVSSGAQWFVHCIYTVRSEKNAARGIGKRSIPNHSLKNAGAALSRRKRASKDVDGVGKDGLGTNMNRIVLQFSRDSGTTAEEEEASGDSGVFQDGANKENNETGLPLIPVIAGIVCSLIVVIIVAVVLVRRKWNSKNEFPPSHAATVVASNGQTRLVVPSYNITDGDNTEV